MDEEQFLKLAQEFNLINDTTLEKPAFENYDEKMRCFSAKASKTAL